MATATKKRRTKKETVAPFTPTARKVDQRTRATTKYPWKEWVDGDHRRRVDGEVPCSVFQAKRGETFECSAKSFQALLYQYARRHGLRVECPKLDDDTVEFQFFLPQLTDEGQGDAA